MQIERVDDIAILRMNAGKANAMDRAFLERLSVLVDQCRDAGAVIITGYDRFFSAGLALPGLIDLDRPAMAEFIDLFSRTMARVYALRMPVIAAINGHALAGGCVLALQTDRRIIVDDGIKLGLNEVQLGLGLPALVLETLRAEVPPTSLGPLAREGRVVMPHEALALDLVHALAQTDDLEARALDIARSLLRLPGAAYAQVKTALRAPVMRAIEATRAEVDAAWLDTWFSPDAQTRLREAVTRLRGG
jgi:enoyl-CoA hydratase